jgi:hypothetical protein
VFVRSRFDRNIRCGACADVVDFECARVFKESAAGRL